MSAADPVWLASGSPRRRDLLNWAGVTVVVRPSDVDESVLPGENPVAYARRLAAAKAGVAPADAWVVAADTVVHMDGAVLHKPADAAEAVSHLMALSDREHTVTTGVCVRRGATQVVMAVHTLVGFRVLRAAEVHAYVATGDPLDKAGAYGIQGRAGAFVHQVQGSWTNVMGLPVAETLEALRTVGWAGLDGQA